MEVEYTLTPQDLAAWYADQSENRPGRPPWLLNVLMAVICLGLLAQVVGGAARGVPWPITAGFALFIAALLVGFFFRQTLIALVFRRVDIPNQSQRLALRPEGLEMATETTASLTAWEGVDRIVVTKTHAFFYLNKVAAHVLPRRAFADEGGFERFVESARTCHEEAKLRSKDRQL